MRAISTILNFLWCYLISLQKLSNDRSYKFRWILTQTEGIKHLKVAHARNICHFEFFYGAIVLPFKKCLMIDRSHKFSWILTETEVISIYQKRPDRRDGRVNQQITILRMCDLITEEIIILLVISSKRSDPYTFSGEKFVGEKWRNFYFLTKHLTDEIF